MKHYISFDAGKATLEKLHKQRLEILIGGGVPADITVSISRSDLHRIMDETHGAFAGHGCELLGMKVEVRYP